MLPLKEKATAFSFNNVDGFCIKIERELSSGLNICFETKKISDIVITTI